MAEPLPPHSQSPPASAAPSHESASPGQWALGPIAWLEHYLPDAFVFALLATFLVFGAGLFSTGGRMAPLLAAWGKGFSSLLAFTLQMAMVIITGHVVASAPGVSRLLWRLSSLPRSPRSAVAFVTVLALLSSWLNWGFSLVFSALLARAVATRFAERGEKVDYRALAAASFLGLGSIWAQGLSGSAALQMATPGAIPDSLGHILRCGRETCGAEGAVPQMVPGAALLPLSHTIFLWQSLVSVLVETLVVTGTMIWLMPTGGQARSAEDLGITLPTHEPTGGALPGASRPGEILEHHPVLSSLIVVLGIGYLALHFATAPRVIEAITLNTVILILLMLGMALHRTPARLQQAFAAATPAVWGVILQFPFYGGIAGVLASAHLNERIAGLFVGAASQGTLPPLVGLYSLVLGIFVPSGGSKWLIEAPYVLEAASRLHVHAGWMVAVYDLGEALANLVQPFWMLPVLGIFGLRARDVMRYTVITFFVLLPVVMGLTYGLGLTLTR